MDKRDQPAHCECGFIIALSIAGLRPQPPETRHGVTSGDIECLSVVCKHGVAFQEPHGEEYFQSDSSKEENMRRSIQLSMLSALNPPCLRVFPSHDISAFVFTSRWVSPKCCSIFWTSSERSRCSFVEIHALDDPCPMAPSQYRHLCFCLMKAAILWATYTCR